MKTRKYRIDQLRKLVYYLINNLRIIVIGGVMSFNNLKAELKRAKVSYSQCADVLGMSQNNFQLKVNEKIPMTISEIKKIRNRFFPDASLDYLTKSYLNDAQPKK